MARDHRAIRALAAFQARSDVVSRRTWANSFSRSTQTAVAWDVRLASRCALDERVAIPACCSLS